MLSAPGIGACRGNANWHHDPLPTNYVADWVCPGGTGAGHPTFSHSEGPERGYKNLAVFYHACAFDCVYCQNSHYRSEAKRTATTTAEELAAVDESTSCICFFGGDPSPQLPHALRAARLARQAKGDRILRICWETNGSMHPALLKQAAQMSLESGGCIKVDLKAWTEELHIALCGVSNRRTLDNFQLLGGYLAERPSSPFLVASTVLVPGYVDRQEVSHIAAFISSVSPDIPYSLLAFHPQFMMRDLPPTSTRQARDCLDAAKAHGLRSVRWGNVHLLGDYY